MKRIQISKMPPRSCDLCEVAAEFIISYKDPMNPGPEVRLRNGSFLPTATASKSSCKEHVAAVTVILLKDQGLIPTEEPIKENNADI